MIIQVMCIIFVSYFMYRQGIRLLFKSRIMDNNKKADLFAYSAFMLTGLILGSYFMLSLIRYWYPEAPLYVQIVVTFASCIVIGEVMYHRNKNMIYKIISYKGNDEKNK